MAFGRVEELLDFLNIIKSAHEISFAVRVDVCQTATANTNLTEC